MSSLGLAPTRRPVPRWWCFTRLGWRSVLAYRSVLAWGAVGIVVQLGLTVVVWRTVYAGRATIDGVSVDTTLGYTTLAVCVQAVLVPWQFSSLPSRVRLGQIAADLTRPVGLTAQVLAQDVGALLGQAPIGVLGVAVAVALGVVGAPAGALAALGGGLALLLGIVIALQLNLLVSMVAFWTLQTDGPLMLYRFAAAFCSGAVIPLWFMPSWLAGALGALPFTAQVAVPLSMLLGLRTGTELITGLVLQVGWIVVLTLLQSLVWARARHRVVVQGG